MIYFSRQNHVAHKIVLESKEITEIFITFYNTVLTTRIYLRRQEKVLDIIVEKGKEPVI